MGYEFDGPNKIISLTEGTTTLDVKEMYLSWKNWARTDDNSKYLEAFRVVGGEPIDENNGIYITSYFFLINGWKIKPQESDHKLRVVNGILIGENGSDPFIHTTGQFNVLIQYSQPIKTESVVIETGISGLTKEESERLFSIPLSAGGLTQEEHEKLMNIPTKEEISSTVVDNIDIYLLMISELYKLAGLDPNVPLEVSLNQRKAGTIVQQINVDKTTKKTTVIRS